MKALTEGLISHAHKRFALSHTMSQWQTKEGKQGLSISQASSESACGQQELKAISYFIAIKPLFLSHPACFIRVVTSASRPIKNLAQVVKHKPKRCKPFNSQTNLFLLSVRITKEQRTALKSIYCVTSVFSAAFRFPAVILYYILMVL